MVKARCSITLIRIDDGDSGIIVSATAPANPTVGQLWQTATKQPIKRWDGKAWVLHYISVDNLDVQTLSAIAANLGTVTAGKIQNEAGTVVFDVENGVFESSTPDKSVARTAIRDGTMTSEGKGPSTNLQKTIVSHEGIKYEHQAKLAYIHGDPDGDFKVGGAAMKSSFKLGDLWILSAIVKNIYLLLHPVGDIVFNVTGVNPGTQFGGTWVAWGAGRVPVGVNTEETEFNAVQKTGGAKTHAHSIPTHVHSVPSHKHLQTSGGDDNFSYSEWGNGVNGSVVRNGFYQGQQITWQNGGGQGNARYHYTSPVSANTSNNSAADSGSASNLQPYITCYMWRRTV